MSHGRSTRLLPVSSTAVIVTVLTATALTDPAFGQDAPHPAVESRFRVGPLGLTPAVTIQGFGLDGNVFNDPENPKSDMTATFRPDVRAVMKLGRGTLEARASSTARWFQTYSSERSFGTNVDARFEMPVSRLTPYVSQIFSDSNERQSLEIDARVRRRVTVTTAGTRARVGSRTSIELSARRTTSSFPDGDTYRGVELATALDQVGDEWSGAVSYRLTPVTTMTTTLRSQTDGFVGAPTRDTNSVVLTTALEFGRTGPLQGRASFGVRRFDVLSADVVDFTGAVLSVDITYLLRPSTQLLVHAGRDVAYAFSPTEPYYLLTGADVTVRQQVTDDMELSAGFGRQNLDYRRVRVSAPGLVRAAEVHAYVSQFTAGGSYRLTRSVNVGLAVESTSRPAGILHQYDNLRITSSVSYGF